MTGRLLTRSCHDHQTLKSASDCSRRASTSSTREGSPPAASKTSPKQPAFPRARSTHISPVKRRSPRRSSKIIGSTSRLDSSRSWTAKGPRRRESQRFFHALTDDHEAADFLLGCLIGNLSLELSSNSEPIRAQLISVLERWGTAIAECLRSGDLGDGLDADEIASQLIEAWEGAVLRGKMIRSRIPYDRFEADTIPALLR